MAQQLISVLPAKEQKIGIKEGNSHQSTLKIPNVLTFVRKVTSFNTALRITFLLASHAQFSARNAPAFQITAHLVQLINHYNTIAISRSAYVRIFVTLGFSPKWLAQISTTIACLVITLVRLARLEIRNSNVAHANKASKGTRVQFSTKVLKKEYSVGQHAQLDFLKHS